MLTVTDTAAAVLAGNLEANRNDDQKIFRISQAGESLSLDLGEEQAGDVIVRHQERPILVLDPAIVDALGDVIIDTDSPGGTTLIIKPAGHEYA
jgi:hypothetical protein